MGVKIKKIEYYLPETILDNTELKKIFPGWNVAKYEKKIGIKQRHIAAQNETALDLAEKACLKVLKDYKKENIDFLILCTQCPDYFLPTSSCVLQDRLGLGTNVGAFDINLGCSGYIYSLAIAKSFIQSNMANNVLLVTSETYSKFLYPKDRSNRMIFGDGASATIVERSDIDSIAEFSFGTDGRGYQNLIVKNGGAKNPLEPNVAEYEYSPGNATTDNNLYMNGPAIFNFTIEAVPKVVGSVLKANSMQMEDIDHVIFHQANKYMLKYLRTKLDIPKEKFYINMENAGNTVSSTIPIAIKDCLNEEIIKPSDKVLAVGFGVGYSWGATIIEF